MERFHQRQHGNYTVYELVNAILIEAAAQPYLWRADHRLATEDNFTTLTGLAMSLDMTLAVDDKSSQLLDDADEMMLQYRCVSKVTVSRDHVSLDVEPSAATT